MTKPTGTPTPPAIATGRINETDTCTQDGIGVEGGEAGTKPTPEVGYGNVVRSCRCSTIDWA